MPEVDLNEVELPNVDDDSAYSSDSSSEESGEEVEVVVLTASEKLRQDVINFVDGRRATLFMAVITIYALFGDDLRLLLFSASADDVFLVLSSIALFSFLIELILNVLAKTRINHAPVDDDSGWLHKYFGISGYFGSFFFLLDFMAVLSLMPEITWLWGPIVGEDEDAKPDVGAARAGRVSRAGSKAGRIIRMVRLVRLVKLYSVVRSRKQGGASEGPGIVKQSNVGSKLSEITTRRVILVVLCMLLCVPIFSVDEADLSQIVGGEYAHELNAARPVGWESGIQAFKASFDVWPGAVGDTEFVDRLVFMKLTPVAGIPSELNPSADGVIVNKAIKDELRTGIKGGELVKFVFADATGTKLTECWFNESPIVEETSLLSILLTIFVCVLLGLGSYMFSSDAQKLVLRPIEHMVHFVESMASDPLTEISSKDNTGQYETQLLENTIKKIGGLLRVGFGRAGASIIAKNLQTGSQLNPMVEGRMMHGIFGFIYITQFNFATRVLQEDVLLFLNKISKIVHDVVLAWGGAPNKNLGEGYLITWVLDTEELLNQDRTRRLESKATKSRLSSVDESKDPSPTNSAAASTKAAEARGAVDDDRSSVRSGSSSMGGRRKTRANLDLTRLGEKASAAADRAMIGFLKIIGEVSRSRDLLDSQEMEMLLEEKEDYRIYMQYGLHVGWAIEGAIGSIHKVDASYLSPHVNISARMMAAARQYGVPLLMSGPFTNLLSEEARRYCRKLDVVAVKGSKDPLPVWTYDIWEWKTREPSKLMSFETFVMHCEDPDVFNRNQTYIPPHKRRISVLGAARIIEHPVKEEPYSRDLFETDPELKIFRQPFNDDFRRRHQQGVQAYIEGEWGTARTILEGTLTDPAIPHANGDGPSRTILRYMHSFNYQAPVTWPGYRALTEK